MNFDLFFRDDIVDLILSWPDASYTIYLNFPYQREMYLERFVYVIDFRNSLSIIIIVGEGHVFG